MASPFGISDESFKKSTGKTFSDIVDEWSNIAVARLKESLKSKIIKNSSLNLYSSIVALPVSIDGNKLTSEVSAGEAGYYWKFINYGVQGAGAQKSKLPYTNKAPNSPFSFKPGKENKPPVKPFINWANLIGRSPFAVRETVWRSGIKPNHFVDDVINEKFTQEFAQAISEAIARTIEVDIKTDFDGK